MILTPKGRAVIRFRASHKQLETLPNGIAAVDQYRQELRRYRTLGTHTFTLAELIAWCERLEALVKEHIHVSR